MSYYNNDRLIELENENTDLKNKLKTILEAGQLVRKNNQGVNLTDEEEAKLGEAIKLFGGKKWPGYEDFDEEET